jgi:D-amino-acid oxidase
MKIAVIGSGIFGSSIALILSKKHKIYLFESQKSIMQGATRANQLRFHGGYHYPRSSKTVQNIKNAKGSFIRYFGSNLFGKTNNYYAIANNNSRTSYKKYINFLKKNKLEYKIIKQRKLEKISNLIKVKEKNLNYFKIKKYISEKIYKNKNIKLLLNRNINIKDLNKYDKVILATYSNNNTILKKLNIKNLPKRRYELVEKIIIKLPKKYLNKSYVVLDGHYVCVDPYVGTNFHLLSDVKNSKIEVLKSSILPNFKNIRKKLINKGIIKNRKISNFSKFISHSSQFLHFLHQAKYIGSYYVVRALKINKEKNDERLGEIRFQGKLISVLSSKWNTCIKVANIINKKING